jgi:uncharacterized protein
MVIGRNIQPAIESNLFQGKVVIVYGPRRVGKTTLVKAIAEQYGDQARYINCDILANRQALETQDDKLLREFLGSGKLFVLDEAQRVLNIGLTLKILVDTYPDIQIIATGSSSFDLSNRISEPLTGRAVSFVLYPISLSELKNWKTSQGLFDLDVELPQLLRFGSYPAVASGKVEDLVGYLLEVAGNYLYKDALEYDQVKKPDILVKLLQLIAFQVGNEVSYNELATKLEVNRDTVIRYIDLLEKAFVVFRLPPFARNLRKEIGKKNKIYFYDLGIRNALVSAFNNLEDRDDVGRLWENFCIVERQKLIQYRKWYRNTYFWRTQTKKEIDYVEEYDGRLFGYEFKWGKSTHAAPKEFLDEYKNSSFTIISRSNYGEFLGL